MPAISVRLVVAESVNEGSTVSIKLILANETSAPLDLYLGGRVNTLDIVITDLTGNRIWRRLEGVVVQAILRLNILKPGEVLELTHEWDQRSQQGAPTAPGVYRVRASVLTDGVNVLESGEAQLEIRRAWREIV